MSASTTDSSISCRWSTDLECPGSNIFCRITGSGRLVRKIFNGRSGANFRSVSRNSRNASPSSHSSKASITITVSSSTASLTSWTGPSMSLWNCHRTSSLLACDSSSRTLHKADRYAGEDCESWNARVGIMLLASRHEGSAREQKKLPPSFPIFANHSHRLYPIVVLPVPAIPFIQYTFAPPFFPTQSFKSWMIFSRVSAVHPRLPILVE